MLLQLTPISAETGRQPSRVVSPLARTPARLYHCILYFPLVYTSLPHWFRSCVSDPFHIGTWNSFTLPNVQVVDRETWYMGG